jgi:hypothetical protein
LSVSPLNGGIQNTIIDFDYSVYLQAGFSLLSTNDMMGSVFVSADSRKAFDRVGNAIQNEACMKCAMIDLFGTPFTEKLHVVKRYRLIDFEEVRKAGARCKGELASRRDRPESTCSSASPSGLSVCSRRRRAFP